MTLFLSSPYSSTVFDPSVSTDGNADESRLAVRQGCCRARVRWKGNCVGDENCLAVDFVSDDIGVGDEVVGDDDDAGYSYTSTHM